MISYLLDTNAVSELARPKPDPEVAGQLAAVETSAAISAVTWHELRFGVGRMPASRRRDALDAFLVDVGRRFPVLPYDRDAATWHAVERARLAASGRTPSFADGQIAAVAATQDLRLVTRNTADFVDFDGLRIESWWGPG